ncbi:uncharacterized protein LOC133777884 [Humulus lupulus]|uniref:uncharacterized protein LOC133777884 n=1 Tax=Humulus lupulus TaxID=3486 RepID=UPI002B4129D8|nr:uncharacterized protein LOC133777884 [Humulus lupulus]XP_062073624.1 uncharacterized protein LOC133777884 [Humulus lupulus]
MENGQNMNTSQTQDHFSMELVNERDDSKSHNDIVMRRMKNRERQRRYRARKRLEEDLKKSGMPSIIEQASTSPTSPIVELEPQSNGILSNYSARVQCRRNWKKDARRAHTSKDSEVYPNDSLITVPVFSSDSQVLDVSGTKAEFSRPDIGLDVVSHATPTQRTISGRRDWKAEARRKRN